MSTSSLKLTTGLETWNEESYSEYNSNDGSITYARKRKHIRSQASEEQLKLIRSEIDALQTLITILKANSRPTTRVEELLAALPSGLIKDCKIRWGVDNNNDEIQAGPYIEVFQE